MEEDQAKGSSISLTLLRVELPFTLTFSAFCHFCYRMRKKLAYKSSFSLLWRNERHLVREVVYLLAFSFISFLPPAEKKPFTNFCRNFKKYCRENNTCLRYLKKCWENKLIPFPPFSLGSEYICVSLYYPDVTISKAKKGSALHSFGKCYSFLLYYILSLWMSW